MNLPSEPQWGDGIPRIVALDAVDRPCFEIGVAVPGGQIVAGFLDEEHARAFAVELGIGYADKARTLFAEDDDHRDEFAHLARGRGSGNG